MISETLIILVSGLGLFILGISFIYYKESKRQDKVGSKVLIRAFGDILNRDKKILNSPSIPYNNYKLKIYSNIELNFGYLLNKGFMGYDYTINWYDYYKLKDHENDISITIIDIEKLKEAINISNRYIKERNDERLKYLFRYPIKTRSSISYERLEEMLNKNKL